MITDFDDVLRELKTGKWNLFYFIAVGLCNFLTASIVLGGIFLTPYVDFSCIPSTEDNDDIMEVSQCSFTVNSTTLNSENEASMTKTKKCSKWDFDNSTFQSTITSDYELVCNNEYWRATYQTVYMLGNLFGSPLNGFVSDKMGRRTTLSIGSVVFVTTSILTAWANSFIALIGLRFVLGLMHPAVLQTGFILCMEICPPKHRSVVGIVISLPWALGTMWWGALGYLIREWRWLQLAASAPGLIILIFLCFFDESPRWLIIKGKHEYAYKVLEKAARWNNAVIPPKDTLMTIMRNIQQASKREVNIISLPETKMDKIKKILLSTVILFRTPVIRRRTLLMYMCFIVASTVFYGLSLNGKNFQADVHIYVILTGLMEVPAYTLTVPIVARIGRRVPVSCCYLICGIVILILAFIPQEPAWLIITLAMVGKLCISSAYQIVYLISSEIFPTEVRLQGLGTSNFVARIGATSSPFITDLMGAKYPWAPSLVFGSVSVVAGFSSLLLPETLNKPLAETVYQLERRKCQTDLPLPEPIENLSGGTVLKKTNDKE